MKVDVLIIGGGIIGACCAYYLSQAGREVVLLERAEVVCPVSGGTHANAGLIAPSLIYPLPRPGAVGQGLRWLLDSSSPFSIKPRPSAALALWLLRFAAASRQGPMKKAMSVLRDLGREGLRLFVELDQAGTMQGGWERRGLITLYATEGAFAAAVDDIGPLRSFGIETEVLDIGQLRQRVPGLAPCVVGGTFVAEDAKVEPAAFTRELVRLAGKSGAALMTATEVLDFTTVGDRITAVHTTRGTFEAETIVLAAGIWSQRLAGRTGLRIPLQAGKGYSITVRRPPGVPEDPPLFLSEARVCATPYGDELRLAGTLELSGLNHRLQEKRLEGIRRGAADFLQGVHTEPLSMWCGLRPLTPDGIPIVGRSPLHNNLVLATGHNTNGLKLGPISGQLVAEIVSGQRPTLDLWPLRVERFSRLRPLPGNVSSAVA